MRFFDNNTGNPDAYYEPNSLNVPAEDPACCEPPLAVSGDIDRYNHREGNDDFGQPGNLFRLFDESQRNRQFSNIAVAMDAVPKEIRERQIDVFSKDYTEYGEDIKKVLG